MADRKHEFQNFPQNFIHDSFQPPHIPRSQQFNPRTNPPSSEFGHPVCPAWRETPNRDPSSPAKRDSDTTKPHSHQMQAPVRGPGRLQHVQPVTQQHARPNAHGINYPTSHNAQVNHPQPEFLPGVPSEHINARQQTDPRAFNINAVIRERDIIKRDISRYQEIPSQEDTVHFKQLGHGHGAQHVAGPNQFTSTRLPPSRDQLRTFLPAAPSGESVVRGTIPISGNWPKRTIPTESQEKSYLRNGIPQSDGSTYMGSYQSHTSSVDLPVQQMITQRRAETEHRKGTYYGNPSSSNVPDILQQQFERLGMSDTHADSLPPQTSQTATTVTPPIIREGAQNSHARDLDRTHAEFSYDVDLFRVDLFRYITRESDYAAAAGGYAEVFTGTLSIYQTATKVAIKAIRVFSNDNDIKKKVQRLKREIEVWRKLDHHSVLKLLGTTSGFSQFPAMVCPWLENGSLTSYLERVGAELPMPRILMLIHEVASGLQYLHSQSVVHGDLSGSNVLVDEKGQACIADFGLSTILHESGASAFVAPSTGKLRATLRWAAPELFDLLDDEDAKNYTKSGDIYSFGGIMLQILSGNIPYHYYSRDAQVVTAINKGETPKRPNDPRVTERRWAFIQRCWSPFNMVYQRPSGDEIVAFSKDDLVRKDIQTGATRVVPGSRYPMH